MISTTFGDNQPYVVTYGYRALSTELKKVTGNEQVTSVPEKAVKPCEK